MTSPSKPPEAGAKPPRPSCRGRAGNRNDIKHGYYSRYFRQVELSDLNDLSASLESEIAALRVYARRLMERSQEDPGIDPLDTLRGLGMAFVRIANLMRAQAALTGDVNSFDATLDQALAAIQEEIECQSQA